MPPKYSILILNIISYLYLFLERGWEKKGEHLLSLLALEQTDYPINQLAYQESKFNYLPNPFSGNNAFQCLPKIVEMLLKSHIGSPMQCAAELLHMSPCKEEESFWQ